LHQLELENTLAHAVLQTLSLGKTRRLNLHGHIQNLLNIADDTYEFTLMHIVRISA